MKQLAINNIFINMVLVIMAFVMSNYYDVITYLSLIQLIYNLYCATKKRGNYMLVYVIFISLAYLFHFGQAIITSFSFEDVYEEKNVASMTSLSLLLSAELFSMLCFAFISFAYMIAKENKRQSSNDISIYYGRLRKLSIIIIVITLLPMLYIDINKMIALRLGGYEATYEVYQTGIGKYLGLLSVFCKPSISLLLLSYSKEIRKATIVFLIATLYFVIMMFTGDRGTYMIFILTNVFIFLKFVSQPKLSTYLLFGAGAIVIMIIVTVISKFRYSDFSTDSVQLILEERSDDGFIYSTLREFGGTVLSLVHVINYVPHPVSFNYGMTYLASILGISPWLPEGVADAIQNNVSFIHAIPNSAANYESLGGSFLGELYYNFGWLSPLFAFFIGKFLYYVDSCFDKRKNILSVACLIVLLPYLFLWVRDFFNVMIMVSFWFYVLIRLFVYGKRKSHLYINKSIS